MKKVFIAGGASYDAIIYLDEFPKPEPRTFHKTGFQETVGSTGSGKALNLSKLDFDVTLHALLGKDIYAEHIRKRLNQPYLKFDYDEDPKGTQRHVNIMNGSGERISFFVNSCSDNPEIDYEKFRNSISESDFVVINIFNYCRNLIPLCRELGKPVWTDLHDYDEGNPYHQDFIDASSYIFLSSDNLPEYRKFMAEVMEQGKELVVCTHGKNGATALTKQGEWIEGSIAEGFDLVDSNGAGDAFFSGFLYAYSQGYDTRKCMDIASITGGMCISSSKLYNEELSPEKVESYYSK